MNIKELKQLTNDYRIKGILSYFWDKSYIFKSGNTYYPYRSMMNIKNYKTIEEIYNDIKDEFLTISSNNHKWSKDGDEIDSFSKILFGDKKYWTKGTVLEQKEIEKQEKKEKYLSNYNDIYFLYDLLGPRKDLPRKQDIIFIISKWTDFSQMLIEENKNKNLSKQDIYTLCKKAYSKTDGNGFYSYINKKLLSIVSE